MDARDQPISLATAGKPAMQPPGGEVARGFSVRETLSYLRSLVYFIPLIVVATGGFGLASLLVSLVDASGRRQHAIARRWARALLAIARVEVSVTGRAHLAAGGPCVLVANHLSYMDTPVIFAELPMQFRILARRWLFSIPCLGWHLRRSLHLPIDGEVRGSVRSLLRAADHVRHGLPVFVFPEGGRSHDGALREFFAGAFFLAVRAHVPVIPMVLIGTRRLMPYGSLHIRPARVRLHIQPPIATEGVSVHDVEKLSAQVHAQMAAVLGTEAQGE